MIVTEVDYNLLKNKNVLLQINTVYKTFEWVNFLKQNQNANPVLLELSDSNDVLGYFIGLIVKKMGIKIFGSPFNGWLTPDMGFIKLKEFDINDALFSIKKYVFRYKKCAFIQIVDKGIKDFNLDKKIIYKNEPILWIDLDKKEDDILAGFTKNGRRDVRAFYRKGAIIKKVKFDNNFADIYYDQLIDVFAKQSLKPFYGVDKIYDLVEAFSDNEDNVLALEAFNEDGKCIATLLSFGKDDWAYYVGAASYRKFQKLLPNEGLFWEFVKFWHSKGIKNLDLQGYREYKMKYNPVLVPIPVIFFEKFPGMIFMKTTIKKIIMLFRKVKGLLISNKGRNISHESVSN